MIAASGRLPPTRASPRFRANERSLGPAPDARNAFYWPLKLLSSISPNSNISATLRPDFQAAPQQNRRCFTQNRAETFGAAAAGSYAAQSEADARFAPVEPTKQKLERLCGATIFRFRGTGKCLASPSAPVWDAGGLALYLLTSMPLFSRYSSMMRPSTLMIFSSGCALQ